MSLNETDIAWTDYSYNFWKGCAKVSEGCRNCWAERVMTRFGHTEEDWTVENIDANLDVYDEDPAEELASVEEGRWVFTPSSSDPCLPWLDKDDLLDWLHGLWRNPQHCYQVLTKWGAEEKGRPIPPLPDNAMLGVSCESRRRTYRIDWLREQDANMKFVSFEPLVERIGYVDLSGIDWIIVGGESHRDEDERREMKPVWATELHEQAREQDVAFFFKQHSGPYPEDDRLLDVDGSGRREFNEFPKTPGFVPDAPQEYL
jgi:protein gp37